MMIEITKEDAMTPKTITISATETIARDEAGRWTFTDRGSGLHERITEDEAIDMLARHARQPPPRSAAAPAASCAPTPPPTRRPPPLRVAGSGHSPRLARRRLSRRDTVPKVAVSQPRPVVMATATDMRKQL